LLTLKAVKAIGPADVIQSATGVAQAQIITCLQSLAESLAQSSIGSPAITAVGDPVRCATQIASEAVDRWVDERLFA
jgi:uroporphyrin-III C-methyltransferase